jgi:uncharacterized protein
MASAIPSRTKTLNALETLVIAAAGGGLFLWSQLPGGLITGAMIAVGVAAIAGRPLTVPAFLTQSMLVLLGISLGSLVSRQLLQHVSAYPLTIALLAVATFCSTFGSSIYLQRFHGWDQTSAFLAGSPGALSQITILAAEKGADVPAIAVVQTVRVIILTAALPMLLTLTGIAPSSPPSALLAIASPLELAELVAASVAVALLLHWIKFPASWMFGAMIGSSLLHGAGIVEGGLPPWVRGVALVGIGAVIGARFARMKVKTLLSHVNAAMGSFAIAILISSIFVVHRLHHPCSVLRCRRRLRARRDGRHAGAGADPAHRPDLRRRASSVALRVRHHLDAGHRPSVRTPPGRCG